jgi:hypothetical protein
MSICFLLTVILFYQRKQLGRDDCAKHQQYAAFDGNGVPIALTKGFVGFLDTRPHSRISMIDGDACL